MEVSEAIRTRRTHKAFKPEPVDRAVLDELFELARWAPNHNLTNPWRFRVIGPQALERLNEAAGPEAAGKLDRAPTLVVWGRSDRMFPASFGQRLAREIAGARFDVLDAGHSPNEECPDAFVHAVSRFLPRT